MALPAAYASQDGSNDFASSDYMSVRSGKLKTRKDNKRDLQMYFSLDMAFKKAIKKIFVSIREYRHQNAVQTFEF